MIWGVSGGIGRGIGRTLAQHLSGLEAFAEALRKEERHKTITIVRQAAVDTTL